MIYSVFQQFLCGELHGPYAPILMGNCPCNSFGKLHGHTGGFYHLVCCHGVGGKVYLNILHFLFCLFCFTLSAVYQPDCCNAGQSLRARGRVFSPPTSSFSPVFLKRETVNQVDPDNKFTVFPSNVSKFPVYLKIK